MFPSRCIQPPCKNVQVKNCQRKPCLMPVSLRREAALDPARIVEIDQMVCATKNPGVDRDQNRPHRRMAHRPGLREWLQLALGSSHDRQAIYSSGLLLSNCIFQPAVTGAMTFNLCGDMRKVTGTFPITSPSTSTGTRPALRTTARRVWKYSTSCISTWVPKMMPLK